MGSENTVKILKSFSVVFVSRKGSEESEVVEIVSGEQGEAVEI